MMSERIVEGQQPWNVEELLLPHTLGRSFYVYPESRPQTSDKGYAENSDFWKDVLNERTSAERIVKLVGFNIFEWIPRNPGLYHTDRAAWARREAQDYVRTVAKSDYNKFLATADARPDHAFRAATSSTHKARQLIYTPEGKISMLQGGIGCVRLRPVELKGGGIYWFMSATSSTAPDEGIPVLVPDFLYQRLIDRIRANGNINCDIVGKTKFISKELSDLYSAKYGIQRLYIEALEIHPTNAPPTPGEVSVAASFISGYLSDYRGESKIFAAYVTFDPGREGARQSAARWLREEYVEGLYRGSILTDFDQQAPSISESLFSLDQVLSSSDLVKQIRTLQQMHGTFDWSMLEKSTFSYHTHEEKVMVKTIINGDNNRLNQAIGKAAAANQTEIVGSSIGSGINLEELATQLSQLRTALDKLPESAERDIAKGAVGKAEVAASGGDGGGVATALKELRPFASKVFAVAEKIGVDVATAAIRGAIGL
jgi:hypothetical protein